MRTALPLTVVAMLHLICTVDAATNQTDAKSLIVLGNGRLPESTNFFELEITAKDGTKYRAVQIRKIEPDGLHVDYAPGTGAIGSAKLKFVDLPESLQKKYGYDPKQAKAFEAGQIAAAAELYRQRQLAEAVRAEREAERQRIELEWAKERMELELRLEALAAANRTADAIERQALEQRRIADGIRDLDWELMLARHRLR